jgi:hypothetical protein
VGRLGAPHGRACALLRRSLEIEHRTRPALVIARTRRFVTRVGSPVTYLRGVVSFRRRRITLPRPGVALAHAQIA